MKKLAHQPTTTLKTTTSPRSIASPTYCPECAAPLPDSGLICPACHSELPPASLLDQQPATPPNAIGNALSILSITIGLVSLMCVCGFTMLPASLLSSLSRTFFPGDEAETAIALNIAPTPTPAPTTQPVLSPPPEPITFEGEGEQITWFKAESIAQVRVVSSYQGTGNFIIQLTDLRGRFVGLAANCIGSCEKEAVIKITDDGLYFLEVTADDAWFAEVTLVQQGGFLEAAESPARSISALGPQ